MSETYRVIVQAQPEVRELVFATEPRVGDCVRLPDLDGNLEYYVHEVVHRARLPHSNEVADTYLILFPMSQNDATRT